MDAQIQDVKPMDKEDPLYMFATPDINDSADAQEGPVPYCECELQPRCFLTLSHAGVSLGHLRDS